MADKELKVKVSAETSQAIGSIEKAINKFKEFKRSQVTLNDELAKAQKTAAEAASASRADPQNKKLEQSFIAARDTVVQLKARVNDVTLALQNQRELLKAEGVDTSNLNRTWSQVKASIIAADREVISLDKNTKNVGISAKQAAAAMRGVPAQFTDIVVSLQAGQNLMSVLLQQGGQLKDMFGGAGNAVRALSGYIVGLLSPLKIALMVAGGLAAAFVAGEARASRLNQSIIVSGNSANVSAGQLEGLIQRVGQVTGSYGDARSAAEALVGSGQIGGQALEAAMRGVAAGVKLTGREVEDLVSDFIEIGKDPVKAAVELNSKYHFLTVAVYEQIRALQEQGRTQEAADLLTVKYADTLESRRQDMVENLGYVLSAWERVKKAASGAWDAVLSIGAPNQQAQEMANILKKLSEPGDLGVAFDLSTNRLISTRELLEKRYAQLQKELAASDAKRARNRVERENNDAKIAASAAAKAFEESNAVGVEALAIKQKKIITEWQAASKAYEVGSDGYMKTVRVRDAALAELQSKYLESNKPKKVSTKGQVNALTASFALGADDLANIKQSMQASIDALRDNLALAKQVYDNAWADNQISIEGYYDARLAIVNKAADDELQAQRTLLERLEAERVRVERTKATTPADKENQRNRLADIDRQILQVNAGIENIDRNRALAANEIANARAREKKSLDESLEALRLQNAIDSGTATAEQRAAAIRAKLQEQYAKFLNDPAAIPDIERKINIEINRDKLQAAEQQFNAALTRMRNGEDSINVQVNTRMLTELQGREQIVALHRQTAAELEKILPLMEQSANAIGPPEVNKIGAWRNEIARLKTSVTDLATQFEGAAKNSVTTFFTDISSGAMSAGQAITRFAANFLSAMAQVAAQQASSSLVNMLVGSFFSSAGGAQASGAAAALGMSGQSFVVHSGGVISKDVLSTRKVPGYVFKDAPRYHTGGIAGLKPNEVPAILMGGPKGTREEVLTADDPRHSDNLGKNQTGITQPQNIAVGVFYTAEDAANAVLNAPNAKRLMLNLASQHAAEFKSAIGA